MNFAEGRRSFFSGTTIGLLFFLTTVTVSFLSSYNPVRADVDPNVPLSKANIPDCGGQVDGTHDCTYPDGSKTSCAIVTTLTAPPSQTFTCDNHDSTKTQCTGLVGAVLTSCPVYDSSGKQIASRTTSINPITTSTKTCTGPNDTNCQSQTTLTVADGLLKAVGGIAESLMGLVALVILGLSNKLLGIMGVMLNWAVIKTVFDYAKVFGNTQGLLISWGILRDIGNMVLLFGFVFIGIGTILDLGNYTYKKALAGLLIFAIALNFSLFAAEAIIDTANVFTAAMYNQATHNDGNCVGNSTGAGAATGSSANCAVNDGLAGQIMQTTGLGGLFGGYTNAVANAITQAQQAAPLYIAMAIFSIIGCVVLGAAAIMLIIRAIVLTGLIVVSPIGFAGMAVPILNGWAKKWWGMLLSQSFFAPVMFLLMLISLKIASSFTNGVATLNAGKFGALGAALGSPDASSMGIILVFMLVSGFMLGSVMVASKMGAAGADFAIKTASAAAIGFSVGGAARIANLGVGGMAAGGQHLIQRYAPNSKLGEVATNRMLRPLQNTNLDLRRIPGVAGAIGAAGFAGGAAAEHATFADRKHQFHDFKDRKKSKELEAKYQAELDKQTVERLAHDADHNKTHAFEEGEDGERAERALQQMSVDELESLHGIRQASETLARNLSPEQFAGLMNSKNLSQLEKQNIAESRFRQVTQVPDEKPDGSAFTPEERAQQLRDRRDKVRQLSVKDLEKMAQHDQRGYNAILNTVDEKTGEGLLSDAQSDKLMDVNNSNVTNRIRQATRVASRVGRVENVAKLVAAAETAGDTSGFATHGTTLKDYMSGMTSKSRAKLGAGTLVNPEVIHNLRTGDLAEIQREAKLSPEDAKKIGAQMIDTSHPDHKKFIDWINRNPNAANYWDPRP